MARATTGPILPPTGSWPEATAAINALSKELRLSEDDAARGIVDVANASMANAVRLSLFEKGSDPADYVLAPFGGAGGLHACAIAEELDIDRVLFPANASTLSAGGILTSDLRHDLSHSELFLLDDEAAAPLNKIVHDLQTHASKMLDVDNVAAAQREIKFSADCRYRGQAYEIVTPWPQLNDKTNVNAAAIAALKDAFHRLHLTRYAHSAPEEPVEIVTIRAIAIGLLGRADVSADAPPDDVQDAQFKSRQINLRDGWRDTPVRHRSSLNAEPIGGPVLIEEAYSSHLIEAGWAIRAVGDGCLMAERQRGNEGENAA